MLNEAVSDMAARHVLAHWRQQACDPGARFPPGVHRGELARDTPQAIAMTPPLAVTDADAVIDAAWFAAHSGRTCYARAAHGWVLVVRPSAAGTRPAAGAVANMPGIVGPRRLFAVMPPFAPAKSDISQHPHAFAAGTTRSASVEPPAPAGGATLAAKSFCQHI